MKKIALFVALAGMSALTLQSCKKEKPIERAPIAITENVSLKINESYTFTMPANTSDDAFAISKQAEHFKISELGKNAEGKEVYLYTPAQDYKGTDQVVMANPEEEHHGGEHHGGEHHAGTPPLGGGHHGGGNCGNHEEEKNYVITINFVIDGTPSTKKTLESAVTH